MNKTFVLLSCIGALLLVQLCSAQQEDTFLGLPCNHCMNVGDGSEPSYLKVACRAKNATLMVQCTDSACKSCTSLTVQYGVTLTAGPTSISVGKPFSCQPVTAKAFANSKCTGTSVSKFAGVSGYCDPADNTTIVCSQGSVAQKTCNLKKTLQGPYTPTTCFGGGSNFLEVACGATTQCVAIHSHTEPPTYAYTCGKCQPNMNLDDGSFATISCGTKSAVLKYECNKGCSKCSKSYTATYNKASGSNPTVGSPFSCTPVSVSVFSSSKCAAKSLVASDVQFTGWCGNSDPQSQLTCSSKGLSLQTCDAKPKTLMGPFAPGKCFDAKDKQGHYVEATCGVPTKCVVVVG